MTTLVTVTKALGKAIVALHRWVLTSQRAIIIILFVPLTLIMFAEVLARYIIGQGFFAIEDFVGYTAVWLYFIGSAMATYERTQISAEIVGLIIKSPRQLLIIKTVVAATTVVVAGLMTQWSYTYVRWSIAIGEETPVYHIPFVYFQMPILIGSFLMTVYFLMELVDYVRRLHKRQYLPAT